MNELAEQILDTVEVGALATVNRDRTPLITPLHFARYGKELVWVSDQDARHSRNAFRTGKAEFVVWDDQKNAVFLTTTVREVAAEDEKSAMLEAYRQKLGDFLPPVSKPQVYAMPIGKIDENSTTKNWLHFIA